jgi:hypothetical protein
MTSFERPDAGLLVEHLLPSLLGVSHALSQELHERTLFFGELGTALESLHGRLTVISSRPLETQEPSQYPWLWRYLSHFMVGAKARAVQHAKLWAYHWMADGEELIELHVSSTNLTASAFKAQVQAGWQVSLPLGQRASPSTRRTWGELVPFLRALGASAGDEAAARIERLVTLLGRAECPPGVTFVASIPGQKSAARQLQQFDPAELHVLTPTIGEWSDQSLSAWTADVGVNVSKVHLKWISQDHPWALSNGWCLSTEASLALTAKGVQLHCLPNNARLTAKHPEGDNRWSHAKLYLFRSRKKKTPRLLITSANWSPSAWGAGNQKPRNFELGVVIETDWTDLERMSESFGEGTAPFCSEEMRRVPNDPTLQWAEASWDGKCIRLHARSSDSSTPIGAVITFSCGSEESFALRGSAAVRRWKDAARTPLTARFTHGAEALEVSVLDLRRPAEFAKTPLPEVDPAVATALREAFLLQRYGGPVVDVDAISGPGSARGLASIAAPPTDYMVQAWLEARAAFAVVDKWRATLEEAKSEPAHLERVRLDGENLRVLYVRRGGAAAVLVAEELGWRISEEV